MTEGTYPYGFGGVSVWCDQLIRGMPGYDFQLVAIVATEAEQMVWSLPDNVTATDKVLLWGPSPARRAAGRRDRLPTRLLRDLIDALLDSSAQARFAGTLRELFEFSRQGDLSAGLASEKAVRLLSEAWRDRWPAATQPAPTLHDAVTAMQLLEHCPSPAVASARPGGHRSRGDQRAGGAACAGSKVAIRHADATYRAWRLPARAVPAESQELVPVAGEGVLPRVHAASVRARLQRGRDDHAGQCLQPALGGAARRRSRRTSAPCTTAWNRRNFPALDERARGSDNLMGRTYRPDQGP